MIKDLRGYTPLPSNIYIDRSPIHGHGLFAAEHIDSGTDFGITHVFDERFPDGLIRTPVGGFINHSFNPNCKIVESGDTIHIVTLATIRTGEELTVDYRPWYSDEALANYH